METTKHYWRLDIIHPQDESDSYSVSVYTDGNETEDSIIDLAFEAGVIDRWEYKEYNIYAEEITNDQYEMTQWERYAEEV